MTRGKSEEKVPHTGTNFFAADDAAAAEAAAAAGERRAAAPSAAVCTRWYRRGSGGEDGGREGGGVLAVRGGTESSRHQGICGGGWFRRHRGCGIAAVVEALAGLPSRPPPAATRLLWCVGRTCPCVPATLRVSLRAQRPRSNLRQRLASN